MSERAILAAGRAGFGALGLVAVGSQLAVHIQHHFSVINFFSYFTNLSNIFAAFMLLAGAATILAFPGRDSAIYDLVRAASVVAMAIVGIVYGVLLRNEDLGSLLPWVNVVVHYVMPVVVVFDWLYRPARSVFTGRRIACVLIYPLVYLVYSLSRGAATGWYPYPFLNPSKAGGYGGVAGYCAAIFAAFLVVGWVLLGPGVRLRREASASAA